MSLPSLYSFHWATTSTGSISTERLLPRIVLPLATSAWLRIDWIFPLTGDRDRDILIGMRPCGAALRGLPTC
uniref:Uncharacterized protein n=2 Tax=Picea TaxID=3328 RepID=A0A101LUP1_PICGL|nr:hypothetical protein ABT39_MTgene2525 [Picea glauca]QHR92911.1 hypothetical protein Q903MT_gene6961 [Picea sitchensis]